MSSGANQNQATGAAANGGLIHIKVTSQNNEEIIFKVKPSTPFEKIIDKYCERFNITNKNAIRFLFDGEVVKRGQTPQELNLEDGDCLECIIEQVGGGHSPSL